MSMNNDSVENSSKIDPVSSDIAESLAPSMDGSQSGLTTKMLSSYINQIYHDETSATNHHVSFASPSDDVSSNANTVESSTFSESEIDYQQPAPTIDSQTSSSMANQQHVMDGHPPSVESHQTADNLPVEYDIPLFELPREVELIPEPREIFKLPGSPSRPECVGTYTDKTKPYWQELTRQESLEQSILIQDNLQSEVAFKPAQTVDNPPPPNDWTIEKLTATSEEDFKEAVHETKVDPTKSSQGFYWLPSNSGIKHNDSKHQEVSNSPGYFDVESVRKDFPILSQKVNGKPLVWLDNAATTQKPQAMIDRMAKFYQEENSNVHRGAHELAARATDAYEAAREKVRRFLGAGSTEEIIFTRGTTESINLIAQSYAKINLLKGDEIILTEIEHHSNIVPWQHITKENGAVIRVAPIHDSGEIDLLAYERLFNKNTKMVAITHVSNGLGSVLPVKEMVETAHRHGVIAVVDGAQSVPHFPVNVLEIGADFYVMSGHKLFGPTGIGVLYGKKHLLDEMPPWQGGGNMIEHVTFEETRYNPPPYKFEAGTAILAGAIGLGASIDYLNKIGFVNAARYEDDLLHYAQDKIANIKGVAMIGTAKHKAGVMSFVTDTITPEEMGELLNAEGIAVRTGHHCAQPALAHYGLNATIRPSIAFYNTKAEIDLLVRTVDRALRSRD
jgi:SufS family cysteine desulfurase